MEISHVKKFLVDRGANVSVKLTSTNYRRSPLVQVGLEIACLLTVTIPGTIINQLLIERYEQLVNQRYVEPREAEEIIGTFLHMPDIAVKVVPAEPRKKKSKSTNNNSVIKSRHWNFFYGQ